MPRITDNTLLVKCEQPVLYIRHQTNMMEFPQLIGKYFQEIGAYIEDIGGEMTDTPYVAFLDFRTMTDQNMHVEIGIPVSSEIPGKGNIKSKILPKTKIVFAYFRGDYSEMIPFYDDILKWVKERGMEIIGDTYEYYLNGLGYPMDEMLTRVELPIVP